MPSLSHWVVTTQFIEPVHLMTALLNQDGGSIRPLLTLTGMDINALRSRLGEELDCLPKVSGVEGDVQLSNGLGRLLNVCDKLAQQRKDQFISSELFVLAALDEKGNLGELLRAQGLTKEKLEQAIDKVRGGKKIDDAKRRGEPPGAGEVHHRPHRAGRTRQARPCDRPG